MFEDDRARTNANVMGIMVTICLILVSFVIVRKLQVRCMAEACMMSGQPGCMESVDRLRISRMFAGK
jgi:hypothetical protein